MRYLTLLVAEVPNAEPLGGGQVEEGARLRLGHLRQLGDYLVARAAERPLSAGVS